MARNSPRRPPPRRPARPGRPPPSRRPAPPLDDEPLDEAGDDPLGGIDLASDIRIPLTRQEMTRRRDLFAVGILTPAILVTTLVALLGLSQLFYPDLDYVEPTPLPDALELEPLETPEAPINLEPIDPVKLNAGVNDRPPAFEWPDVDDLKLTVEPSRPNEQADYTPALAATELRRLIAVMSVNITLHTGPAFAEGGAEELAKSYALRRSERNVIDVRGRLGYIPDDTGVGLVFTAGNYRVQLETIAASPPIRSSQRAEMEYHTLHLGDHIARRIQETISSGKRNGPEAAAVHWRDHISRSLPFGR
jgi:hypothetical protein